MNAFILIGLLTIGLVITLYRFQKKHVLFHSILVFALTIGAVAGYCLWGSWREFHQYQHQQALLHSIQSPQELIDKIQQRLQREPESAKGWFLLGRLYAAQGRWRESKDVFRRAHHLDPDNEQFTVNYAQSIWQNNGQHYNAQIRHLYQQVLKHNPNQADALSMLAIDAFQEHDYHVAIQYWTHLLSIVSQDSPDAQAIRKAIAKARSLL